MSYNSKKSFGSLDRSTSKKKANPIFAPTSKEPYSPSKRSAEDRPVYKKHKKRKAYIHQSEPPSNQASSENVLESSISKSIGNLYPAAGDSSDDEGLIDIEKLVSTSPQPTSKSEDDPVSIETFNETSDEENNSDKVKSSAESEKEDNNASILQSLSKRSQSNIDTVKEKYKDMDIPSSISSRKKLIERAEKHIDIIPKILRGKLPPSFYYDLAKKQRDKSIHETMGGTEKFQINWESFYGGYYGLKRQSIIGTLISNRFQQELKRSANTNRTVSYWTIPRFCTYVLANEILIRMVMEDMKCDFEKAEEIISATTDYGIVVADSMEVEFDLDDSDESSSDQESEMKDSLLAQILG
ncbi:uncharacterized protein SPAPADRAFT_66652 [Spathaspora passalidarum NRRL Y-27907]|uniref:Restriction of telomere capping protein 4 n=1 Tax=Spathaspora passalidarum (strain NRRL Y-27907 / 11-Y1) TaxID=619300 RepID=G3ANI4_SPAPN|nr:uncharacterized protein SPAPADRAFT_66652 [Spathaspora passalidarum NRRL Y-27907]EGW31973.1 hypothetical protein SPAPADRAFT_66652 [Spathaspora passalidarum NRRL Y-27907]